MHRLIIRKHLLRYVRNHESMSQKHPSEENHKVLKVMIVSTIESELWRTRKNFIEQLRLVCANDSD